jgi:hypothetical protein
VTVYEVEGGDNVNESLATNREVLVRITTKQFLFLVLQLPSGVRLLQIL